MAYTEFKSLAEARNAISGTHPHKVPFQPNNLKRLDEFRKLWNLGEEHFGLPGLMTDGTKYLVDFDARWMIVDRSLCFRDDKDAVMMLLLRGIVSG